MENVEEKANIRKTNLEKLNKELKNTNKEVTEKDGEMNDISSLLCKESSEMSSVQQDSAYNSVSHSAYSSQRDNTSRTPKTRSSVSYSQSTLTTRSNIHSSKSSGFSFRSTQQCTQPAPDDQATAPPVKLTEKKEAPDRRARKKRPKICNVPVNNATIAQKLSTEGFINNQECKAAMVANLSQALGYVDQFRRIQASKTEKMRLGPDQSDINNLTKNFLEASQGALVQAPMPLVMEEKTECIPEVPFIQPERSEGNGFCAAVSLHDGMVKQTTASLSGILGYPKDMWVGRSFIDFVHPLDKDNFIAQVTENIGLILRDLNSTQDKSKQKKNAYCKSGGFFCRIRKYNGLKSGFSVKERKTRYGSFKLSVCFLEMDNKGTSRTPESGGSVVGPQSAYIFITAIPLHSAFVEPWEELVSQPRQPVHVFVTKHSSGCTFSNIDESALPYLGFLPQDLVDENIFNYIHPLDLGPLKDVFKSAMLEQGRPVWSRGVRFKVRNGGFIQVNSWWSSFINPWSRLVEFVHGKHTVVKGPCNPDVFADPEDNSERLHLSDEQVKLARQLQNEIKHIFSKAVHRNSSFLPSQTDTSSKTKKELTSFMGTLLEEVAKADTIKSGKIGAVVIGNICPHQSDSSETPPSYNQLTFNENLNRFFNSQPKTLTKKEIQDVSLQHHSKSSDDTANYTDKGKGGGNRNLHKEDGSRSAQGSGVSGEQVQTASGYGEGNGNNSSTLQTGLSAGHVQGGDECMMSPDESGSGSRLGSGSRDRSVDAYIAPTLTIELMAIHNKDMEHNMLCNYKKAKKTGDIRFIKEQKNLHVVASSPRERNALVMKTSEQKIKVESSKPLLQSQPEPAFPGELLPLATHWSLYGGEEEAGAGTKMSLPRLKHGHEGFVGFNQANMMERGVPATMLGYNNVMGVPSLFMPMSGTAYTQSTQMLDPSQAGIMRKDRAPRYIPMVMGDPNHQGGYHNIGAGEPGAKDLTDSNPPELPNCLAVSCCIVSDPINKKAELLQEYRDKFVRPLSATGSRATSVKGEPGSALESNALASAHEKNVFSSCLGKLSEKKGEVTYRNCLSTTSSSLYSFLKTSEDYNGTQHSGEECPDKLSHVVARPILYAPFWNERVTLNTELVMEYQLETREKADVLLEDLDKMRSLKQNLTVMDQITELNGCHDTDLNLSKMLLETGSTTSDDDTSSADDSGLEFDEEVFKKKRFQEKARLERSNMFLEEDAPLPLPDAPKLALYARNGWNISKSPNLFSMDYSSESSNSSNTSQNYVEQGKTSEPISNTPASGLERCPSSSVQRTQTDENAASTSKLEAGLDQPTSPAQLKSDSLRSQSIEQDCKRKPTSPELIPENKRPFLEQNSENKLGSTEHSTENKPVSPEYKPENKPVSPEQNPECISASSEQKPENQPASPENKPESKSASKEQKPESASPEEKSENKHLVKEEWEDSDLSVRKYLLSMTKYVN